MPYVNVRLLETGVTPEQKDEVIRRITDALVDVLGKDPASTFVVIDEVPAENWGMGGASMATNFRRKGS
ncbi:MAG: 4-oxalocrotonate tautomerase family protein [Devosia sp.]|nr:4-oxalocrotonate tautomerase family protein [Devosia sp.]